MIERLLLDTAYALALLNPRDQYHLKVMALLPRFSKAEVWVTEAVLTEIGDGLSTVDRVSAFTFIRRIALSVDSRVINVDSMLFQDALNLYGSRSDKRWSLTDCISFVIMKRNGLALALTSDHHFVQAGFRALMLEEP